MGRKEGYYWVKYHKKWLIVFYNPENIYYPFCMDGKRYMEKDFDEISDRIPMPNEMCKWKCVDDDENYWEGSCGIAYNFIDGGPKENDITFCPHCGRRIKIIEK